VVRRRSMSRSEAKSSGRIKTYLTFPRVENLPAQGQLLHDRLQPGGSLRDTAGTGLSGDDVNRATASR